MTDRVKLLASTAAPPSGAPRAPVKEGDASATLADPITRDAYLTASEVAARLNVSKSFMDQARCRGDGPPFVRIGRAVRYRWGAVVEWAEARAARSTSEPAPADQAA